MMNFRTITWGDTFLCVRDWSRYDMYWGWWRPVRNLTTGISINTANLQGANLQGARLRSATRC